MATRDLLRLVWSNLRRMKARVAMTAIGVVIGTAAVVILISLAAGIQRSAGESFGSVSELTQITVLGGGIVRSMGGSMPGSEGAVLNDRALKEFRQLPGVVAVTPRLSLMAGGDILRLNRLTGSAHQIVGIDPTQVERLGFEFASGTGRLGRWQALVGARVADEFYNPQTRRPAQEAPDLQGQGLQLVVARTGDDGRPVERIARLRVSGVLEESGGQDDYALYLALNDVSELNSWLTRQRFNPGRDGYDQVLVKVADPEQALTVEQEIMGRGFVAWSARSMMQQMNIFFLVLQGLFGGIGAVALIVAAFGIANTMTMAIYERTGEIGLMKAVGATNRDVMSIFLAEAGSIGLLGGVGGVLLGVVLGSVINLVARTYLAAQAVQGGADASDLMISIIHTPLWLPVFALLFSAVVGVVSGIYPAVRAARLSPVAALKYE